MQLLTLNRFQGVPSKRSVRTHFPVWGFFFPTMGNGIKTLEREVERGT